MKRLVGKTIEKILIDKLNGENFIQFITNDGNFLYEAQGDCCSESWFADIIGVRNAIGSRVTQVEDVKESCSTEEDSANRSRQEYDLIYSIKIHHTNGILDVIFRNSSNGYYGGGYAFVGKGIPEAYNPATKKKYEIEMFEIIEDYQA